MRGIALAAGFAAALFLAADAQAEPTRPIAKSRLKSRRAKARRPAPVSHAARRRVAALSPVGIEQAPALDPFFEHLAALDVPAEPGRVVRVLHFGDSHVAADFWTEVLRLRLQQRFGDAGPGYVLPGHPWRAFRHSRAHAFDGEGWVTVGLADAPVDGWLGLGGLRIESETDGAVASVLGEGTRFEVQIAFERGDGWPRIFVDDQVYGDVAGERVADDQCGGRPWVFVPECAAEPATPGSEPALVVLRNSTPLAPGWHRISVAAEGGRVRLLNLELRDGRSGILYDTLGTNGARLSYLDRWASDWRRRLIERAGPGLIVVSYGTNDLGADYDGYFEEARRILSALRAEAPAASVLVTGPPERSSRYSSRRTRYGQAADTVTRALRDAAAAAGCAFWDTRAAMGGRGSMRTWLSAGYARRDYTHLTASGYERMGTLLADQLLGAYDAWRAGRPPAPQAAPEPEATVTR